MYPRQLWLFKFGCWTAMVSGALQLVAYALAFAPGNDVERAASAYRFMFPLGAERSLLDVTSGFSLASAVLLASLGAVGLVVVKRGHEDDLLMLGVARAITVTSTALLAIALAYFFVVPAMFIALMTVCFSLASVSPPAQES